MTLNRFLIVAVFAFPLATFAANQTTAKSNSQGKQKAKAATSTTTQSTAQGTRLIPAFSASPLSVTVAAPARQNENTIIVGSNAPPSISTNGVQRAR